jgi:dienelactone hydrolase
MSRFTHLAALAATVAFLSACQTDGAPGPTTTAAPASAAVAQIQAKASAPAVDSVSFQSADYDDYAALYRGAPKRQITLKGDLSLPPNTAQPVPAIIFMHASGGRVAAHESWWVKEFTGAGFAVLAVDYFGPRNLRPPVTVRDLSYASVVADIYGALRKLAADPRVDGKRIAVVGFSRGAEAARQAAFEPFRKGALGASDLRLAAHVALYPLCVTSADGNGVFTGAPVLIVGGEADEATPIANCRQTADYFAASRTSPLRLIAYPGAAHSWDDPTAPGVFRPGEPTSKNCIPLLLDASGKIASMVKGGQRVALDPNMLRCAGTGATSRFDAGARQRSTADVLSFLKETLKP